ncbi:MAG: amino acid transporter [Chloroflexota bacterium]|nr:amino acid transporter [Chloroflexota bacterium]
MNVVPELSQEWAPLTLEQVAELLRPAPFRWWIAGGWAIELFVGHPIRPHKDVEVTVLPSEQGLVRQWLDRWEFWYVPTPGGLRRWGAGERLEHPLHEIWARPGGEARWRLELLLENTASSDEWSYRRDARITLPLDRFGTVIDGKPVVRPEVALLYKSKDPRENDQYDFAAAAPLLSNDARRWLGSALKRSSWQSDWLAALS